MMKAITKLHYTILAICCFLYACQHSPIEEPEKPSLFSSTTPFAEFDRIPCGPSPEYGAIIGQPRRTLQLRDSVYLTNIRENPFTSDEIGLLYQEAGGSNHDYLYLFNLSNGEFTKIYQGPGLGRFAWLNAHTVLLDGVREILAIDISSGEVKFRHAGFKVQSSPHLGYFSFYNPNGWGGSNTFFFDSEFNEIDRISGQYSSHIWHPTEPVIYYRKEDYTMSYQIGKGFEKLHENSGFSYHWTSVWSPDDQSLIMFNHESIAQLNFETGQGLALASGCSEQQSNRRFQKIVYLSALNRYIIAESEVKLEEDKGIVWWKWNWYTADLEGNFINQVVIKKPNALQD